MAKKDRGLHVALHTTTRENITYCRSDYLQARTLDCNVKPSVFWLCGVSRHDGLYPQCYISQESEQMPSYTFYLVVNELGLPIYCLIRKCLTTRFICLVSIQQAAFESEKWNFPYSKSTSGKIPLWKSTLLVWCVEGGNSHGVPRGKMTETVSSAILRSERE